MICAGMYEAELRTAVLRAKLSTGQPLAAALAEALWLTQRESLAELDVDAIVPVPMHWRRRWQRGVNHTETMAAELGHRLEVPVRRALRRVIPTAPQGGLSAPARRRNLRGAFRLRFGTNLTGKRVLLIDDIVTTGATCIEAARVLREAGAAKVTVAAISRADRPISGPGNRL
jgi:ComF family protein